MFSDPKTTIAALVAGVAQILKFAKVIDMPNEVLDAITGIAVIFFGIFAKDAIKKEDSKLPLPK